jgi:hypothetical protein
MWKRHGLLDDTNKLSEAVMSLVRARDLAAENARIRDEQLTEVMGFKNGLEAELARTRAEGERLAIKLEELKQKVSEIESDRNHLIGERDRISAEAEGLKAVLELITNSRTWRLKKSFDRLFGRSRSG